VALALADRRTACRRNSFDSSPFDLVRGLNCTGANAGRASAGGGLEDERRRQTVLVAIDVASRRPVKILRARPTRHFLYLLIQCRCGKKFGHRADRHTIVCYKCGRLATLREVRGARALGRRFASAPSGGRTRAVSGRARAKTTRRTVVAPLKRGNAT
jgi:hypothetical protein